MVGAVFRLSQCLYLAPLAETTQLTQQRRRVRHWRGESSAAAACRLAPARLSWCFKIPLTFLKQQSSQSSAKSCSKQLHITRLWGLPPALLGVAPAL